jgi:cytochrome c5
MQMSAETAHDAHSSFIKTPQQLIVVVVLSFVIPIFGIVLLVQLVIGQPSADPNALKPEAVAARLQPVGRVEFGAAGAGGAAGARTGEQIVKTVCATCHQTGVANAPKIGDKAAWAPRIKKGQAQLVKDALNGVRAMPARGGDGSLSDLEVERAVVYLVNQAGGGFKEPAAPKAPAGTQQPAAADGKQGK